MMANYGESFLSRVLDDGTVMAIREFAVKREDFSTESERQAFDIIMEYAETNRSKAPDFRTVVESVPDFYYREGVTDSYRYLVEKIKSFAAKRKIVEALNGSKYKESVEDLINEKDGFYVLDYLISEMESIKMETGVRTKVGTDLKRDGSRIKEEYKRRKDGESFRIWESWFDFINKSTGGYTSSNIYVPYGRSGRGKSAITLMEVINLAMQGANVLIWAMEMGWYELFVRMFTYYSRVKGNVATANIDGVDMDVGFNSSDLRRGTLPEDFEERFFEFIESINELLDGNIIVRGVDDEDFVDRSLAALESDIIQTEADVVVLDPMYYLDYEPNTSKKTGGDAENTSKKLRRLAGTTQTVVFAITQAEEVEDKEDDLGIRELKLPQRKEVKKTKQLLEDAAILIAVDTNYQEGRGLIGINKGRDGGEGEFAEIIYLPQYGIIEELSAEQALFDAI